MSKVKRNTTYFVININSTQQLFVGNTPPQLAVNGEIDPLLTTSHKFNLVYTILFFESSI